MEQADDERAQKDERRERLREVVRQGGKRPLPSPRAIGSVRTEATGRSCETRRIQSLLVLVTMLQWGTDWYDVVGLKLGRVRMWVRVLGWPVVAARGIAMLETETSS